MADNIAVTPGVGATIATDDVAGVQYQKIKVDGGADGATAPILGDSTNGLDVDVTRLPAPLTVVGGGTEATALRVTVASDSTGVVSVDDGGGALTVDGTVALGAGSAAIGKLAANSGVDIGDVDVLSIAAGDNNIGNVDIASAIPAGTNLIGKISASNETASVYNGATALTPKFAAISAASSGDNTLVSAVADKKVRVLAIAIMASGDVNARFESGAGGTALTGLFYLADNVGFVLPYNPIGWFETGSNTLLNLELSGATAVGGCVTYIEV